MDRLADAIKKPYRVVRRLLLPERPMPPKFSNVEYNREYWNRYAKAWDKTRNPIENPRVTEDQQATYIKYLGDEWGRVSDVEEIVAEYIYPFITKESVVAEIGVGGARVASKVVEKTRELHCFDISAEMLKKAQAVLGDYAHVSFHLLEQPRFPDRYEKYFDFVYSFDVFVHLDLHTIWKYLLEIHRVLKDGGKAFVHTTNLQAPDGWERFASQEKYDPAYHYFISPEIVQILAQHSHLNIVKTSCINPNNFYLNRDYLVILAK